PGENLEYNYRIELGMRHNHLQVSAEQLIIGQETVFAWSQPPNVAFKWLSAPQIASLPPYQGVSMLGNFPSLEKVVFAYAALSTGIGYYYFPSTTLDPARQHNDHHQEFLNAIPGLSD